MPGAWSTRANALTLLRLLAAPALVAAVLSDAVAAAAALFALGVATDFADGWVARRYGEDSLLGGLVDHAVDATFVTCGTAALASKGVLPSALPALIAVAFLEYAWDARRGRARGLRPSALGRWNGIAYYAVVGVPIVRDAVGLATPGPVLVRSLGWLLVVTTLVSIGTRLRLVWGSPPGEDERPTSNP